jgi:hypothetical protein
MCCTEVCTDVSHRGVPWLGRSGAHAPLGIVSLFPCVWGCVRMWNVVCTPPLSEFGWMRGACACVPARATMRVCGHLCVCPVSTAPVTVARRQAVLGAEMLMHTDSNRGPYLPEPGDHFFLFSITGATKGGWGVPFPPCPLSRGVPVRTCARECCA